MEKKLLLLLKLILLLNDCLLCVGRPRTFKMQTLPMASFGKQNSNVGKLSFNGTSLISVSYVNRVRKMSITYSFCV